MTGPIRQPAAARPVLLIVLALVLCAALGVALSRALADDSSPGATGGEPSATGEPEDDRSDVPLPFDASEPGEESTDTGVPSSGGAAPPPVGGPGDQQTSCPPATVGIGSADELQRALDGAKPGDVISLADGTYTGAFVATKSGSEQQPIFLCGGTGAVLEGEGVKAGYVLHLDGVQYVRVVGFTVRNGQKGVMADGTTNSVIQGLTVETIGDEGIHLRSASSSNAVLGNTVRKTGLRRDKFGEGIYVGSAESNWEKYGGGGPDRSDNNLIQGNSVSQTTSESVDIKEGTTGGKLIGNVLDGTGMSAADSLVDVKGNNWLIEGNVGMHAPKEGIQTHRILDDWGSKNVFRGNTVDVDGDGLQIYIHKPEDTDNEVYCDNRSNRGEPVKSNVDCLP